MTVQLIGQLLMEYEPMHPILWKFLSQKFSDLCVAW